MANFVQLSFSKLIAEIQLSLSTAYQKAGLLFSLASPYGQIISVVADLFQLHALYLKNSVDQFDISQPDNLNKKIIWQTAIVAGHNPFRAISATGTLRLKVKSTANIQTDLATGRITIDNKTHIKNNTNSLDYAITLGGVDDMSYSIGQNTQLYIPIVQGLWSMSTFTSDGTLNQTFTVTISGVKQVENFNVLVYVNGAIWIAKKHIYEMLANDQACVIKTSYTGAVDIIFGNGDFGAIPNIGAVIEVKYLLTDGSSGNIFRRTVNDWTFVDSVLDGNGNSIEVTSIFDIYIYTDINFGADSESIEFTKNLLPFSSNNFVIALPQQYAYTIKRLGVFSHVNAFEQNGSIVIAIVPNIKLFKNTNQNYFTIDEAAFSLDSYEKSKIDTYLKSSGNIQLTKKYSFNTPILKRYALNIFVIYYSDAIIDNVNNQIVDTISDYFLDFQRIDRVPISNLVNAVLDAIDGIDSLDITFLSEDTEEYHRTYYMMDSQKRYLLSTFTVTEAFIESIEQQFPAYDRNYVTGLDPILGDIIFDSTDYPLIRGGFYDRNGIYYKPIPDNIGLSSINIFNKGLTDRSNIIRL